MIKNKFHKNSKLTTNNIETETQKNSKQSKIKNIIKQDHWKIQKEETLFPLKKAVSKCVIKHFGSRQRITVWWKMTRVGKGQFCHWL